MKESEVVITNTNEQVLLHTLHTLACPARAPFEHTCESHWHQLNKLWSARQTGLRGER